MIRHALTALLAVAFLLTSSVHVLALDVGARVPDIGLRDLNGQPVSAAALRGKVVVVDFWASWCAPCREELPVLERLYKAYGARGFVVVGVSVDRDAANARSFARRLGLSFPIVHDAQHQLAGRFSPPKMPSSYIIDRRGVVRHVHGGYRAADAATIEREIKALLAE